MIFRLALVVYVAAFFTAMLSAVSGQAQVDTSHMTNLCSPLGDEHPHLKYQLGDYGMEDQEYREGTIRVYRGPSHHMTYFIPRGEKRICFLQKAKN